MQKDKDKWEQLLLKMGDRDSSVDFHKIAVPIIRELLNDKIKENTN